MSEQQEDNLYFANNTQQMLDEGIHCHNDFVSLVISGERLRRTAAKKEMSSPALDNYDAFVRSYKGEAPTPDELTNSMVEVFIELRALSVSVDRDWEKGVAILDNIDDVVALATALVRSGHTEAGWLFDLCHRTWVSLHRMSTELADFSSHAFDHIRIYAEDNEWQSKRGDDSSKRQFGNVYSFWDALAMRHPDWDEFEKARRAAKREFIIAREIKRYEEAGQ
jgi:hypothetical protein